MSAQRKRIQLLPEHLINQIKAGEVIDRPASLLKEILENAIDAESTQINLHLIDNGLSLISLEDNGKGISFDDLPLAFARHATSKLEKFEDLYSLHSFGFRGEALASIASIARVTCNSIPRENLDLGGKILIEGGEEKSLVKIGGASSGTSLYIKDLFYNTPARLKFIKSKVAEKNSLKRIIYSFLLAHPEITFSLRFDEKEKQTFPSCSTRHTRIQNLLVAKGQEKELFSFEERYEDYQLQAFLIPSECAQGNNNFLFINKRLFVDKGIHQALMGHLEQLCPDQRFQYVLFLEAPKDEVDVNIHPGKIEVRFFKSGNVFSLISASLKKNFKRKDPLPPSNPATPIENISGPQRHFSPNSSYIQKEADAQNFNWKLLANLALQFQLLQIESDLYLIDSWKYCCKVFENKVLSALPLKEEAILPLLVSEPYPFQKSVDLDYLKTLGLELDKLSEETLVLRTIPEVIRILPYRRFIEELLISKDISLLGKHTPSLPFYLQESQLVDLLENLQYWLKAKIALPLNDELVKKFFTQEKI